LSYPRLQKGTGEKRSGTVDLMSAICTSATNRAQSARFQFICNFLTLLWHCQSSNTAHSAPGAQYHVNNQLQFGACREPLSCVVCVCCGYALANACISTPIAYNSSQYSAPGTGWSQQDACVSAQLFLMDPALKVSSHAGASLNPCMLLQCVQAPDKEHCPSHILAEGRAHPLDPLSSAEITSAAEVTRTWAADQGLGALRFNVVALQVQYALGAVALSSPTIITTSMYWWLVAALFQCVRAVPKPSRPSL
jgi:hypothetical protein